ncbi:MAG TPA: xanthine dehydrogenase family protein molybdopterin-binding subunit [Vicinamibacterales bacterium]|jgi:CO/xanthine dehydrogenase Mo-binding subunit|nr:xanthine dehydrogenase family protein molybdopterin-binding subunit [Vicinamibacterales bacterium]
MPSIGRSIPRREGRSKVTGRAQYVDDLTLPGMLFGATVRSTDPRGLIRRIDFDSEVPWSEFVVVTAADVPGVNRVALIVDDQPCLAADRVNHPEEPVVLLAHPDRHLVEEARRRVHIVVDPEPAVFSMDESLAGHTIVWGRDNIFKNYVVTRGDVDAAIANADVLVEGEYETGAQEQLYIEPNGMVATGNPADGVTVWGSMQCPYYIHKALKAIFNLPADKIRVVQMETGGGFGGKEEYPSIIACHAALLAWKAGAPVKLVYDRAEDMVATTKRHPSRTRHRTAVTRDGRLVAMDIDFVIDGGAYCTLSPVVLSRGTIHSAGPYLCPNVRLRGRAVATNAPPHGAFRGFGAPQSLFALERHMDRVAAAVGLTPDALRRRNFIRAGDTSAVGQVMRDPIDMVALLERALSIADYHAKRARFDEINPSLRVRKGIGLAAFMHGAGFTGSGEDHLASVVAVEAGADGRVRVLSSNTEIGQGTNTIFAQIAADTLGVPAESIEIAQPDTSIVPDSGPTVASRTCMVVGKLVETAARGLIAELKKVGFGDGADTLAFERACAAYAARFGPLRAIARYQAPPGLRWDDETYQGDAYGTYAWAVYVAEVSVDMTTWETRVDDFVAVQEVGKVINPTLATGQIEGGVAQAIGWALYERIVWREGRMANGEMTNYIMPTSMDLPPIRVFFEEQPYAYGPGGAKGIGELPMDGPAPAILNAVAHATGADPRAVPLMPETLMTLMETARV